jgi:hypothetical protein
MRYFTALLTIWITLSQLHAEDMNISKIKLPGRTMGGGWKEPTGVAIDDLSKMKAPNVLPKATADQYIKLGVTSLANLAYRQEKNLLEQVEIKIFIFKSEEKRAEWTNKKYGYSGWEKHYKKSEADGATIWDSTQINKRIIAFKNLWITSSALSDKGNHIKLLNEYVTRLNK